MEKLEESILILGKTMAVFKDVAEKNAAMLSEKIEKLSAPAEEIQKPKRTRKSAAAAKTAKKEEVKEKPPVVLEEAKAPEPVKEEKPVKRQRKPRAASPKQEEKKVPAKPKAEFILYNCDESKSPASMYNRNDETFRDTQLGRRALWNKLKGEISGGKIEILENYPMKNIRLEIAEGEPESINKYLKYGLIEKTEKK